jgi:small-conductance mechanosensitive channel
LHEFNVAIEAEFRREEIEFAFPQQEIYIKNLGKFGDRGQDDRKAA